MGIHTGDLLSDGKRESFNEILLEITAIIGTKLRPFLPTNVLVVIHLASRLQQPHVGNMGGGSFLLGLLPYKSHNVRKTQ